MHVRPVRRYADVTSRREMRMPQQTMDVPLQHVPQHLRKEGITKLLRHLGRILHVSDLQLFVDTVRMQKIPTEHKRIDGRVNGMYPAGGYEKRIPLHQRDAHALVDGVAEEDVGLLARQHPPLVQAEVVLGGGDEPEHLAPLQYVVPDGRAAEVHVEVGVAPLDRHETVLLHFGVFHVLDQIGGLRLAVFEVARPHAVHPIDLTDDGGTLHVVFQFRVTEFQRYDVEQFVFVGVFVVFLPFFHRHLAVFLRVDVHDVEEAARTDAHAHVVDGEVAGWHAQTCTSEYLVKKRVHLEKS